MIWEHATNTVGMKAQQPPMGQREETRDDASSRRKRSRAHFILVLECDLSLQTGYSINERESTIALLDQFPDRVTVVCPYPAHADVFLDRRIEYVRDHGRYHPARYPLFLLAARRKLDQLVRAQQPAAVVFRLGPFPLLPAFVERKGIPIILKKLSGYSLFARKDRPLRRWFMGAMVGPLYRYVVARCLGADIESHAYAEWLPSRFQIPRSKLFLVPNGANTRFFKRADRVACRQRYGWDRFRYIVGYVGAIDSLRRVDDAVEAARHLSDVPGLGFVLIGDGPLTVEIKRRIQQQGLSERVVLPGSIPYTEVPSAINCFDIAIDLSLVPLHVEKRTVFGSFSQKIAQYLACGVPVITWETPDTRFLDSNGVGRTVPIGDARQLATAIRSTLATFASDASASKARSYACETLAASVIARQRITLWDRLVSS